MANYLGNPQNPLKNSKVVFPSSVANVVQNDRSRQSGEVAQTGARETKSSSSSQDKWKKAVSFKLNPFDKVWPQDAARKTVNGLETAIDTLEVAITALETINNLISLFQSDINNLFKVLEFAIQEVLDALEDTLVSIASTGIYAGFIPPDVDSSSGRAAGGGFDKVMSQINHMLRNKQDPNRPIFMEGDLMGAAILVVTAGTNMGDLLNDIDKMYRFFGGGGTSPGRTRPPKSLSAQPGLYYPSEKDGSFIFENLGNLGKSILGVKVPGIKLSWGDPQDLPNIVGYRVYRSKSKGGTPVLDSNGNLIKVDRGNAEAAANQDKNLRKYEDLAFNRGNPVEISVDGDLVFLDLEIIDGETYYYKVVPLFSAGGSEKVEVESVSLFASATAVTCLPENILQGTYETPDGLLEGVGPGEGPYWESVTLRGILGEPFDTFLNEVNKLADRLRGVAVSSEGHFDKMIEELKRWVSALQESLEVIKKVLESLKALQFSSNVLTLTIPSERGGVDSLRRRINNAGFSKELEANLKTKSTCEVYGGVILVAGVPTQDTLERVPNTTREESAKIKAAGNLGRFQEQSRASYEEFYGQNKDKIDNALSSILGLFGG